MTEFNLKKFLVDVFNPQSGETVLVMTDKPHGDIKDTEDWHSTRRMAKEWREAFIEISKERDFQVIPFLEYDATGEHGARLPEEIMLGDEKTTFSELFTDVTLVVALTRFSATAPLADFASDLPRFRGASMPGVTPEMQKTALAADYKKIQDRCKELERYMKDAVGLHVQFSTGHECYFDLRFRQPSVDDGKIDQSIFGKKGDAVLNLPGGETFEVPYEGEREEESLTKGELPLVTEDGTVIFTIDKNRIIDIKGDGENAAYWKKYIEKDSGRRNIAEVAFGCNEMADPEGPPIESEKAAFHWAVGLSDHLGGVTGEDDFDSRENASHHDFIYVGKNSVRVKKAELINRDEKKTVVMKNGEYLI